MVGHREIQTYLRSERIDPAKEDIFVNITLCHVSGDLVQKFIRNVAANYPGGIGEAVQDLMRKALKK